MDPAIWYYIIFSNCTTSHDSEWLTNPCKTGIKKCVLFHESKSGQIIFFSLGKRRRFYLNTDIHGSMRTDIHMNVNTHLKLFCLINLKFNCMQHFCTINLFKLAMNVWCKSRATITINLVTLKIIRKDCLVNLNQI